MNGKLKNKNEKLQMGKIRWLRMTICVSIILNFHFFILDSAQAQVKWHTVEEAAKANIGERIYFVDFYTSWCGYCKKMDRETFSDPIVAKILNKYYYPVKFNAESGNTFSWHGQSYGPSKDPRSKIHQFARGLQGYPSFVLYRADGSPLQVIPGFYPPDQFIIVLWYFANGDCDRYPFERYARIFDKEIRPQMEKQLK